MKNQENKISPLPDIASLNKVNPCEEHDCEHLYNPLFFALHCGDKDFSIGLGTLLQCLRFAEKQGDVPKIPPDWWTSVSGQYPQIL